MDDKKFNQLLEVLRGIDNKISILISLKKSTMKTPDLGEEENVILKLCNGKNSIEDMMKTTEKSNNNVKVTLTHLRKKGLIKSVKMKGKLVYVKI